MSIHAAKPVTLNKKHAQAQITTCWRIHIENRFSSRYNRVSDTMTNVQYAAKASLRRRTGQ